MHSFREVVYEWTFRNKEKLSRHFIRAENPVWKGICCITEYFWMLLEAEYQREGQSRGIPLTIFPFMFTKYCQKAHRH